MSSAEIWSEERIPGAPSVVFLHGWAHDWRIMSKCPANVNPIYIRRGIRRGFGPELADFLKRQVAAPVTIVGWSLGGFAAVDFASVYPELVRSLVLIGVRDRYTAEEIQATKDELSHDKNSCLEGFYRRNFLPSQRRDWSSFKAELMNTYLAELPSDELDAGLDYLATARLDRDLLCVRPTLLVHGKNDVIASADVVSKLAGEASAPIEIIEDASHAAFLQPDFPGILEKWLK